MIVFEFLFYHVIENGQQIRNLANESENLSSLERKSEQLFSYLDFLCSQPNYNQTLLLESGPYLTCSKAKFCVFIVKEILFKSRQFIQSRKRNKFGNLELLIYSK